MKTDEAEEADEAKEADEDGMRLKRLMAIGQVAKANVTQTK